MKTIKPISISLFIITTLLSIGQVAMVMGQNLSANNFNYYYDLAKPLQLDFQVIGNGSNSFVLFSMPMSLNSAKKFSIGYYLTDNLAADPAVYVPLKDINKYLQSDVDNKSIYGIRTATNGLGHFILTMSDTIIATSYYYDFILPTNARQPSPDVLIYKDIGSPLFVGSYIPENTEVKFNSLFNKYQHYRIQYISHQFEPALPPMSRPEAGKELALTVDTVFSAPPLQDIALKNKGLYIIQGDSAKNGLAVRVENKGFPKPATLNDLIESMVYLATKDEYDSIQLSDNKKAAFDKFWLYNINSTEKAKRTLSGYYNRVKEANILFTSYKEGWKTDMGMIYTIFGPPTNVFRDSGKEIWIYNKTFELPKITFTFRSVNTALAKEYFVLERSQDFKYVWFRAIELWRKGRKEF